MLHTHSQRCKAQQLRRPNPFAGARAGTTTGRHRMHGNLATGHDPRKKVELFGGGSTWCDVPKRRKGSNRLPLPNLSLNAPPSSEGRSQSVHSQLRRRQPTSLLAARDIPKDLTIQPAGASPITSFAKGRGRKPTRTRARTSGQVEAQTDRPSGIQTDRSLPTAHRRKRRQFTMAARV